MNKVLTYLTCLFKVAAWIAHMGLDGTPAAPSCLHPL
jgi:hypothetical protein